MRNYELSRDWNIIIPNISRLHREKSLFVNLGVDDENLHHGELSDRLTDLSATSLCFVCECFKEKNQGKLHEWLFCLDYHVRFEIGTKCKCSLTYTNNSRLILSKRRNISNSSNIYLRLKLNRHFASEVDWSVA